MSNQMEKLTDRIIEQLKNGTVPWHKPWVEPQNLITQKPYRGYNAFVLGAQGYDSPYWVTVRQAKTLNGWIKREEWNNGTLIIYWNFKERKIEDSVTGEELVRTSAFMRCYTVYNIDQCERLHRKVPKQEEKTKIIGWKKLVQRYKGKPKIENKGNRAYYRPMTDEICLPAIDRFDREEDYANVLFHEMNHSTGHKGRLKREGIQKVNFGSNVYSKEELIAEIGAAFLCGKVGIVERTIDNSSAYIQSWLKVLNNDRRMILTAAAEAQKSVDWILGNRNSKKGNSKNKKGKSKK